MICVSGIVRGSGPFSRQDGIELLGVTTNSWVPTELSSYEDLACSNSLPAIRAARESNGDSGRRLMTQKRECFRHN
jgi:hypothetical protein